MKMKSLVLIEDNPQDEMLIRRILRKNRLSCDITVMRDGQQAVDFIFGEGEFADRCVPEPPSVILLDIGLPRLSGLEVLTRLRADVRTRLMPVVMFTSSDDERDCLRSYQCGANSFVHKPLDFAGFTETVERISVYWLSTNTPLPDA